MIFGAPRRSQITAEELTQVIVDRPTPWGEYAGAVVADSFRDTLPGIAAREVGLPDDDLTGRVQENIPAEIAAGRRKAPITREDYLAIQERTDTPVMSEDEWKQSEFYRPEIPFDGRMTQDRARYKAETFDADQFRAWQRQNREWGAGTVATAVVGSLLGSAPDPTNYIPIFGTAFKAAAAGRAANIMRRAGVQAFDAAAITAAVQPAIAQSRRQFGDDVSFADQAIDVALSAALGGIFGGAVGLRERLVSVDPKIVQPSLEVLHRAANDIAMDQPISVAPLVLSTRRQYLSGTSLSRFDPPDLTAIARATDQALPFRGRDPQLAVIPIADNLGRPRAFDTKSQADKARRELKAAGTEVRVEQNRNGTFRLTEPADVQILDTFAAEFAAQNYIKRLPKSRRDGLEVVPMDATGRRMFAVTRGLSERQIEAVRKNPSILNEAIDNSPLGPEYRPRASKFAEAFEAANPPEATRFTVMRGGSLKQAAQSDPAAPATEALDPLVKKAEANLGAPAPIRKTAEDQDLNIESGEFPELADYNQLAKAGGVTETEAKAFQEASEIVTKSEQYAKAYEAAAACLARRG